MNTFNLKDLFQNDKLASVLPQVDSELPKRGYIVYSYAETQKRVMEYLARTLGGTIQDDKIIVKGKHKAIIERIKGLKETIEQLFNNMPSITKNLRKNTKVYLPYGSISQIAELKTPLQKQKLLQAIMDNVKYNPDFATKQDMLAMGYVKEQEKWQKLVGYQ